MKCMDWSPQRPPSITSSYVMGTETADSNSGGTAGSYPSAESTDTSKEYSPPSARPGPDTLKLPGPSIPKKPPPELSGGVYSVPSVRSNIMRPSLRWNSCEKI